MFEHLFALSQVVLDCPMDACFTYIYQYEPYLKDPVGFPKVTVSQEKLYSGIDVC